jgi:hypothetical protein
MADSKLRIPRVALAVLVLGGACGDDESDEKSDGGSRDAGGGHDAGDEQERDAGDGQEHDAGDGPEQDAGGGSDDDAGGADADGGNVVDISDTRIQKVASDFCEQGFACEVEEVVGNFDDIAACVADSVTYWQDYIETLGEDCIDAQLDLYACAALLSCGEDVEDSCSEQIETTGDLCADGG